MPPVTSPTTSGIATSPRTSSRQPIPGQTIIAPPRRFHVPQTVIAQQQSQPQQQQQNVNYNAQTHATYNPSNVTYIPAGGLAPLKPPPPRTLSHQNTSSQPVRHVTERDFQEGLALDSVPLTAEEQNIAKNGGFFNCQTGEGGGRFMDYNEATLALGGDKRVWETQDFNLRFPSGQLRVFLSSTFTDTATERNKIIEDVTPAIRNFAKNFGISVQIVELRWGILPKNTADHLTWEICRNEIKKCYEESMGIFFVSLVSEKYGWRPLPRVITQDVWTHLENFVKAHPNSLSSVPGSKNKLTYQKQMQILYDLYTEDFNASPPQRLLKLLPSHEPELSIFNQNCELVSDLLISAFRNNSYFGLSVTHWETIAAMMTNADPNRIAWFQRKFGDLDKMLAHPGYYTDFLDCIYPDNMKDLDGFKVNTEGRRLLGQLKKQLKNKEIVGAYTESTATLEEDKTVAKRDDGRPVFAPSKAYVEDFCKLFENLLERNVEACAVTLAQWADNAAGTQLSGEVMEECVHHVQWAKKKQSRFFGREDEISEIKEQLEGMWRRKATIWSRTYSLVGKSGCGKTALLSKVAAEISGDDMDTWTIIRFCGTSRFSTSAFGVVKSICQQLVFLLGTSGGVNDAELQQMKGLEDIVDYDELVQFFHKLLCKVRNRKLYIIIDSLDQLSDANEARRKLNFLPSYHADPTKRSGDQASDFSIRRQTTLLTSHKQSADLALPENVFFLMSTIPDDEVGYLGDSDGDGNEAARFFGCSTRINELNLFKKEVSALRETDSGHILDELLKREGRVITQTAVDRMIREACEKEQSPLFINLVVSIVSKFRSYEKIDDFRFLGGVEAAISYILEKLELDNGQKLVTRIVSYITYANQGVSENEILDLLSLDSEVLDETFQFWQPPIRRMPQQPVIRVLQELGDLIVTKAGLMQWYHRQVWETVEKTYKSQEAKIRADLGNYFSNRINPRAVAAQRITAQPLFLPGTQGRVKPNGRRCKEGAFQFVKLVEAGGDDAKANARIVIEEVCTLESIEARARMTDQSLFEAIKYLSVALSAGYDEQNWRKIPPFMYWLRREGYHLKKWPENVYMSAFNQPTTSYVREKASEYRQSHGSHGKLWCRILPRTEAFDPCVGIWEGHILPVNTVAITKDGKKVISGGADTTLRVWDLDTGRLEQTLEGHTDEVTSVVVGVSAGGRVKVVSGSRDATVRIWDLATGVQENVVNASKEPITCVAITSDGSTIYAGSDDLTVKAWNFKTLKHLHTLEGHDEGIISIAISPDSRRLVSSAYDMTLRLWDLTNVDKPPLKISGHWDYVSSLAMADDGTSFVTASYDKTIRIFGFDGRCERTLTGRTDELYCVAVMAGQGQIVSGGADNSLYFWNLDTGTCDMSMAGHTGKINAIAVAPDGLKVVSASHDGTVRVWDIDKDLGAVQPEQLGAILSVDVSENGSKVLTASSDGKLRVWNVNQNPITLNVLEGHTSDEITGILVDGGTKAVSGGGDKTIRVWDLVQGVVNTMTGHKETVSCVAAFRIGNISYVVSGSADKTIKIWDMQAFVCKATLEGHTDFVSGVSVTPDGNRLVSCSYDKTVRVWDIRGNRLVLTMEGHTDMVYSVKITPDGKYAVSCSADMSVCLWDINSGQILKTLLGHTDLVLCVALTPDSKKVVSGSMDSTVRIWDLGTGHCDQIISGSSGFVNSLAIAGDSTTLTTGSSDSSIVIWDLQSILTQAGRQMA
ncbi:hypothetical protein HDU76_002532 [Blyttiomyces sp. JEL0837]|nr:hypothetical protein HDU76_002532 [Blyttiomyces sp. JEL0837]